MFSFASDHSRFANDGYTSRRMLFSLFFSLFLFFVFILLAGECSSVFGATYWSNVHNAVVVLFLRRKSDRRSSLLQVSNVFFFLVPPVMIFLFASYSKRASNGIRILWMFLIAIGIGSVYFHATLSLVGSDSLDKRRRSSMSADLLGGSTGRWNLHPLGANGCVCTVPSQRLLTVVVACSTVIVSLFAIASFSHCQLGIHSLFYDFGVTNRTRQ